MFENPKTLRKGWDGPLQIGRGSSETPINWSTRRSDESFSQYFEDANRKQVRDPDVEEFKTNQERAVEAFSTLKKENLEEQGSLIDLCAKVIKSNPGYFGDTRTMFDEERPLAVIGPFLQDIILEKVKLARPGLNVPHTIARYLFDHQIAGLQFLGSIYTGERALTKSEQRGGILADDMGLGKTVQIVAFLAAVFNKSGCKSIDNKARLKSRCVDGQIAGTAHGPALLVVPVSVLGTWKAHFEAWGIFDVVDLEEKGMTDDTRIEVIENELVNGRGEIVLIGHGKFPGNKRSCRVTDALAKVHWRVAIFDEVHHMTNVKSRLHLAAEYIRAPCKIGLTGTVMSNRIENLWAIMKVLSPQTFGPKEVFSEQFASPIRKGRARQPTRRDIQDSEAAIKSLSRILDLLVLKRSKSILGSMLTEKEDQMVLCPLTKKQRDAYIRVLESEECQVMRKEIEVDHTLFVHQAYWRVQHRSRAPVVDEAGQSEAGQTEAGQTEAGQTNKKVDYQGFAEDPENWWNNLNPSEQWNAFFGADDGSGTYESDRGSDTEQDTEDEEGGKHVFRECRVCRRKLACLQMPTLIRLAHISNHLELVRADPELKLSPRKKDRRLYRDNKRVAKLVLGENARYERTNELRELVKLEDCGKLRVLWKLLKRWTKKGIKVLVFSNSLVLLDVLEKVIRNEGLTTPLRLDGSTPACDRTLLCNRFNSDSGCESVFLISTLAGGEGLTLTGASKVVIMDPHWNPTRDLQAQDRCYRIGQTRNVNVYRLISQGTIEEIKYLRQVEKSSLSRLVMEGSMERRFFDENEFHKMEKLLTYPKDGASWTKLIMERYKKKINLYRKKGSSAAILQPIFEEVRRDEDKAPSNQEDDFTILQMNNLVQPTETTSSTAASAEPASHADIQTSVINWESLVSHSNEEAEFQENVLKGDEYNLVL